jgi:DivIVA domain-containing protein
MPLTPEDVQNKRFTTVRFKEGYDEEEVDAFLDEVETELRRLLGENDELRRAPKAAAPAPVAPPPPPAAPRAPEEQPQEAALRTLLLAQRTADEAIAQAKAEADQIVSAARMKASALEQEAQQQHAAAVADLQRQRNALESQIDSLRGFEREYRTRLKAYLEGQLRELESQPASAAPTPPPGGGTRGAGSPPSAPPAAQQRPPAGPPTGDVPRLAPPPGHGGGPAQTSPFSQAPPMVEDVDTGSDAPTGPPREPGADHDVDTSGGSPG